MRRGMVSTAIAVITVLAFSACDSGNGVDTSAGKRDDKKGKTEQIGELDPDEVSRLVDGVLSVQVEGAAAFSFEREVPLRIVTINQTTGTELQFFSVGIHDMQQTPDGGAFRIAFDLAGEFEGAGDYEIPQIGGAVTRPSLDAEDPDANEAASALSKVYLTYSPLGDPTKDDKAAAATRMFENVVEACELEVDNDRGESGRLDCPKVADSRGDTVSITMEWEKA